MIKEFRIIPAGPCWETEDAVTRKRVLRSPTKRDLIFRTMELARKEEKCKIIIHHLDGTVEEEKLIDNNQEKKLKDFLSLYYTNLDHQYKQAV